MIGLKSSWDKVVQKIKENPKIEWGIYVFLVVIVIALFFYSSDSGGNKKTESKPANNISNQSEELNLETKLQKTLSTIQGAGKVEVMISYSTSVEIVPAMQKNIQSGAGESSSEQSQPVTVRKTGEDSPMVLMEKMPQIKGVIVVAQGAHSLEVKLNLLRATQTALDIDASMIEVFVMNE